MPKKIISVDFNYAHFGHPEFFVNCLKILQDGKKFRTKLATSFNKRKNYLIFRNASPLDENKNQLTTRKPDAN